MYVRSSSNQSTKLDIYVLMPVINYSCVNITMGFDFM